MRRLTTAEEIKELERKKVIKLFSNYDQLLNGKSDKEALLDLIQEPFNLFLPDYLSYLGEEKKIFDMGNGYFLITDKQKFHKAVNSILAKDGLEKLFPTFEETMAIYRVVEYVEENTNK